MREPPVRETPCNPAPTAGRVLSKLAVKSALLALVLAALFFVLFSFSTSVTVTRKGLPARGRETQVHRDLRSIITVAEAIYTDARHYPESIDAMVGYKNEDGTAGIASLEKYPKDPWGHEYLYEITSGGRPRVRCLGSDGRPGGEGEAADAIVPNEEDQP